MAATAYVSLGPVGLANPSLGPGPAGLEISWIVLADDGSVAGGPAGEFVMVNFSYGQGWSDVAGAVTSALQANYPDLDGLTVTFLAPGTS